MSALAADSDELLAIGEQARRFLREFLTPESLREILDAEGGFDRNLWTEVVAQGWPGLAASDAVGGIGLGMRGLATLAEALGESNGSVPLVPAAVLVRACEESADASALASFAVPVAAGEKIACLALSRRNEARQCAGQTLRLEGGRLYGQTAITPFAAVADVALVVAIETHFPVVVVVPLDTPGLRRVVEPSIDNARAPARLQFEGAPALRLASAGSVSGQISRLEALAALGYAGEQLGGATACLHMSREYSLQRIVFGQPIGRFQGIKHKIAAMYARIEVARGCVLQAVDAEEAGDDRWIGFAAAARLAVTDAYEFAARENVHTHGGLGTTWEGGPHHHYRRSRALALELGNTVYWRERLLSEIGLPAVATESKENK